MEGLTPIGEAELAEGTALNLQAYRDVFSPFSRMDVVDADAGAPSPLWVDPYYGLVYGDWVTQGGAPYGVTDLMPEIGLDADADLGFLRVPFARFPRMTVRSRQEVESILDSLRRALPPAARLLLRGQTREFTLDRPPAFLEKMYGSAPVIEPSLTPSASRRGIDVNGILPEWSGLLKFLLEVLPWGGQGEERRRGLHAWFHHYGFSRFALSMAQHYGLPSSGLDVTPDPGVALFFASHTFSVVSEEDAIGTFRKKEDWSHPSVLYVFAPPTRHHAIDFAGTHPADLPATRPARQQAFFLHRGWGLAQNDCARWLTAAMYLGEDFDGGAVPTAAELFPGPGEDPFGAALGSFRRPDFVSGEFQEFLHHLYWIGGGDRP